MLGPFFDTVVVCAMTALIIVVSEVHLTDLTGVQLTSAAFETVLPWFPVLLTVAVILFALSTAIAWFYFGLKSWTYLVGEGHKKDLCFKIIFCAFTVVGASADLAPVIDFSDVMIFAMSIPNVIGLYLLMPVVKAEVEKYWLKWQQVKLPTIGKPLLLNIITGSRFFLRAGYASFHTNRDRKKL